jgi:hypothetical protein
MNKKLGAASILLTFAALAGCNSFPTQEYNKAGNTRVHVIALAPVGLPDKPQSLTLNAVGNNFGLIGGIVEATRASNASNELLTELAVGNLEYRDYLPQRIISNLQSAGFDVVALSGTRSSGESSKFLANVPQAPGADAILDIYANYIGYVAAGAKTDYRPAVHIKATGHADPESAVRRSSLLQQLRSGFRENRDQHRTGSKMGFCRPQGNGVQSCGCHSRPA